MRGGGVVAHLREWKGAQMSNGKSRRQRVIEEARRILGSYDAVAEALDEGLSPESFTGAELVGEEERVPGTSVARALKEEASEAIDVGLEAMKKVEAGEDEDITPEDQQGLEAIILLAGRPAILIQDGDFMNPPKLWAGLKDVRQQIQGVIRRVGRIEVAKHPDLEWVGTGWLAGKDVLFTNRHVAVEFSRRGADGAWTFRAPMSASLNMRAELGSEDALSFAITSIIGIHEDHDLAVLRVEQTSGSERLPDPLPIAKQAPATLVGSKVYVVGFPAWDGRRNDPEPMKRIFQDIYNVKRLHPGEISGDSLASFEIFHDCSTLGGNSGSPVVNLDTHQVIGLHFGGRFLEQNHAVPLWTLQNDELIKRAAIIFQ